MTDAELADELLRLETALAARDPDGIEGGLMALIADEFLEFGRSGRTWTRASIREVLEGQPRVPVPIEGFALGLLSDGVALVTYRTPGTKRSSVWLRRDGRWRMRFHQGTPADD